jgi:hypothetical protein
VRKLTNHVLGISRLATKEVEVGSIGVPDCSEMLLDLLCYEICRDKLSSETKAVFMRHLAECPACRKKVVYFWQLLREDGTAPHLDYRALLLCSRS